MFQGMCIQKYTRCTTCRQKIQGSFVQCEVHAKGRHRCRLIFEKLDAELRAHCLQCHQTRSGRDGLDHDRCTEQYWRYKGCNCRVAGIFVSESAISSGARRFQVPTVSELLMYCPRHTTQEEPREPVKRKDPKPREPVSGGVYEWDDFTSSYVCSGVHD